MRLLKLGLYLIFGLSIVLLSCEKDEEEEPDTSPSMTAKIDGTSWAATAMDCELNGDNAVITGGKPGDASIVISLDSFEVGTTELTTAESNAGALVTSTITYISNGHEDAGGSVTISSINTTDSIMSGTFSFIVYSPYEKGFKTISEGKFKNIPFSDQ